MQQNDVHGAGEQHISDGNLGLQVQETIRSSGLDAAAVGQTVILLTPPSPSLLKHLLQVERIAAE